MSISELMTRLSRTLRRLVGETDRQQQRRAFQLVLCGAVFMPLVHWWSFVVWVPALVAQLLCLGKTIFANTPGQGRPEKDKT